MRSTLMARRRVMAIPLRHARPLPPVPFRGLPEARPEGPLSARFPEMLAAGPQSEPVSALCATQYVEGQPGAPVPVIEVPRGIGGTTMRRYAAAVLLACCLGACAQPPASPPQQAAAPPAPQEVTPPPPPRATSEAQIAPGRWDVERVRCSDLLGAADDDREAAAMFYYGYLAAKAGIRVIDVNQIDGNVRKVMDRCAAAPNITVPQAFRQALGRHR
jgi:HdeA/HdeB family